MAVFQVVTKEAMLGKEFGSSHYFEIGDGDSSDFVALAAEMRTHYATLAAALSDEWGLTGFAMRIVDGSGVPFADVDVTALVGSVGVNQALPPSQTLVCFMRAVSSPPNKRWFFQSGWAEDANDAGVPQLAYQSALTTMAIGLSDITTINSKAVQYVTVRLTAGPNQDVEAYNELDFIGTDRSWRYLKSRRISA